MSSADTGTAVAAPALSTIEMALEVVTVPVADIDRALDFYASFKDPDGNGWVLQEITTRIPGRGWDE